MFNMGLSELLFLAVIALIVVGPKQLPEIARTIAKLLNEFKRATSEITKPMKEMKTQARDFMTKIGDQMKEAMNPVEKENLKRQLLEELQKSQKILEETKGEVASLGEKPKGQGEDSHE